MSNELKRAGLAYPWLANKTDAFMRMIDETGGWPQGFQYVGFAHTDEREASFRNSSSNTGWWTCLYSADDYYLWKLSPAALQRFADAIYRQLTITRPDIAKLRLMTERGWEMERTK